MASYHETNTTGLSSRPALAWYFNPLAATLLKLIPPRALVDMFALYSASLLAPAGSTECSNSTYSTLVTSYFPIRYPYSPAPNCSGSFDCGALPALPTGTVSIVMAEAEEKIESNERSVTRARGRFIKSQPPD